MASIRPFHDGDIEHALKDVAPGVVREATLPDEVNFLQKHKITINQITSSVWLQRWLRCDFPLFSDKIIAAQHEHNLANINPYIFIPSCLLFYALAACRIGLIGVRFGKIDAR